MFIEREHLEVKMTRLDWPQGRTFIPAAVGKIEVHGDLYQDGKLVEAGVSFFADDKWWVAPELK